MATPGWQAMLHAAPGTALCFEKPDLYLTTSQCIRYATPWPIGYADDGAEHTPKEIHSIRIPIPDSAPRLHLDDVKFLHYGMVRIDSQRARNRLYCVIENVRRTSPVWRRRAVYAAGFDWTTRGRLDACPREWFDGWERIGIDMTTVPSEPFYWHDYDVLRYFKRYGPRRFWADDIWDCDWEACRAHARNAGVPGIPDEPVAAPPAAIRSAMTCVDRALPFAKRVRARLGAGIRR
jgi:hypothetical protein